MTDHKRRVIWFSQTEQIARHPESLVLLRDEIGLTTIMPESPVCHTSGFAAGAELAARSPFRDWRDRADRYPRVAEGIYPPVAGVIGGFDDTDLRRVIDAAHAAGIEVWGHIGLWSYGGQVYPEFAMRDVDGALLDERWLRWGIGLCPSHPAVNDWTADGLAEVTANYEVDGFCVDHARYPQPANPQALLACGCEHCLAAGQALGFDAPRLAAAARAARQALRRIDAASVRRALDSQLRGVDLLPALGVPRAALTWLQMRAAILAERMAGFRARVGDVRAGLPFGSDVFAPSIALTGGHDLARWEEATDFLTGGNSHSGVVGWASAATSAAASWAGVLCADVGLGGKPAGEARAVALCLRLLMVDDVAGLPRGVQALTDGPLPLEALYEREVARLMASTSGRVPRYPPISAGGDPERTRRLAATVRAAGCDGAMVSLNPDSEAQRAALRAGLGPLAGA